MCVALIGGMDRLQREYMDEAKRLGIKLKIFTKSEINIDAKVRNADAIIIFTNKVSHRTKREVMNVAKTNAIRVLMNHSCGICTLRDCLSCLKNNKHSLVIPAKSGIQEKGLYSVSSME